MARNHLITGIARRAAPIALVIAAIAGTVAPSAALAGLGAGSFVGFDLAIGNSSFGGTATPDLTFRVKVTAPDGTVKGTSDVTANGSGYWTSPSGLSANIEAGDRFRATVGGTTVGSLTVPALTVRADRVSDRVRGRAPKGSSISVMVTTCLTGAFDVGACTIEPPVIRPVSDRGRWSADVGSVHPRGGDRVTATWTKGPSTVLVGGFFPYLVVRTGSARLEGFLYPGGRSVVELRRGGKTIATANAYGYGAYGYLWSRFRNGEGRAVTVRNGDLVVASFADDGRLRVRAVFTGIAAGLTGFGGTCLPNASGTIFWTAPPAPGSSSFVADADGLWSTTVVTAPETGSTYTLDCGSPAGDVVRLTGSVAP